MQKEEFDFVVREALEYLCPGEYEVIFPGHCYCTNEGVCLLIADKNVKIGFGVLSSLTPSSDILKSINNLNRKLIIGNVWLSEGADNDHWSLIFGTKFFYSFLEKDNLSKAISSILAGQKDLFNLISQNIEVPEKIPYWSDENRTENTGAAGLVLMSKLG